MRIFRISLVVFIGFLIWSSYFFNEDADHSTQPPLKLVSAGNVQTFLMAYNRWENQIQERGSGRILQLPLSHVKGLSSEFTRAKGQATLDLKKGLFSAKVFGLPLDSNYEIWMVDEDEYSSKEKRILVGQLMHGSYEATLQTELKAEDFYDFELDQLVVSIASQGMKEEGLLFGSPNIFQKLFYNKQQGRTPAPGVNLVYSGSDDSDESFPFGFLIPTSAHAQQPEPPSIEALIAQGEDLFFNETFGGNGRTCGSCHPAENNFTIDSSFIATLPPNDPLFVAEFNSGLTDLENPILMRQFGLIRANVDGFEDPVNKFVMRSVPHLLGMARSIQSNAVEAPFEMTGWSGDGAPGGGTLRDFSTGAVTQHFPLSLNRTVGVDFRLPTEQELDALEAFMLSLGRQHELDLTELRLNDTAAERGRNLFITEDSENRTVPAAKCNICHRNAGALTVAGFNQNFVTGVENMFHLADGTGQPRPRDDGFGTELNSLTGGFGDESFNTAPLWEAADTAPFFHHNGAATLEDAIGFYESSTFRQSIEGQRLLLLDSGGQELTVDVDALAAFLRAINVLENLRSSMEFLTRTKGETNTAHVEKILTLAQADLDDAIGILNEGELHPEVVPHLQNSKNSTSQAFIGVNTLSVPEYDALIDNAVAEANTGRNLIANVIPLPDTTAPTVSITAPTEGSNVSGSLTISADATDDTGISNVSFIVDQSFIGQMATEPFDVLWDTTPFSDGPHQIIVVATDESNNSQLTVMDITVDNSAGPPPDTIVPTVSITGPTVGSDVSGMVSVEVDATDNVGIAHVFFIVDQTFVGHTTTGPFQADWDTSSFSDGPHHIFVVAMDPSNNAQLAFLEVDVDNSGSNPPPPPCTIYSCPKPPPPPAEPPPPPITPPGSSPDGEFETELIDKDNQASTITVDVDGSPVTLKITSETIFNGSIALDISQLLPGHIVQGEFFNSTKEIVWIEADLPPGF